MGRFSCVVAFVGMMAAAIAVAGPEVRTARACCMAPTTYEGKISQKTHEGIIFWNDGREELILRIDVGLTEVADMPSEVAWIVTVPSVPDGYDASADPGIFKDAWNLFEEHAKIPVPKKNERQDHGGAFGLDEDDDGLDIDVIEVGPFEIHEIKVTGENAVGAMNEWLAANGFPTEDPDHMAWFAERRMTWLCIKVKAGEEQGGALDTTNPLPPLRVSFASDKPYYPLKFSSRQGVFPLMLHIFSSDPIDFDKSKTTLDQLRPRKDFVFGEGYWRNVPVRGLEGEHLEDLERDIRKDGHTRIRSKWIVNRIESWRVNWEGNPIREWTQDVTFELGGDELIFDRRKWEREQRRDDDD